MATARGSLKLQEECQPQSGFRSFLRQVISKHTERHTGSWEVPRDIQQWFQQDHSSCPRYEPLQSCGSSGTKPRSPGGALAPVPPPAYNGTYLCFQLISKVGVIKLYETEKEGTLLSDAVIFGDLFFHILFQEGHIAEEATSEGSE